MKCTKIIVYGEVQGVGFRRFIWSTAKRLGLKGYVRNLSNGGVEIVIQGDSKAVTKLMDKLKTAKIYSIDNIIVGEVHECIEYSDFEIL